MSWQMSGRSMELCSCKALCPCWLGPDGEPDQEWCAAIFGFEIEAGNSDGIDLAGAKMVFMIHWPENFFSGNGSGRLYIDDDANADQQRDLEAIFSGSKGGMLEGLWGAVLKNWHPSRISKIDIQWGDNPEIRVGGIGEATLKPFQDGAGKTATLTGAAAQAAFHIDSMRLASARTGSWSDPDLGSWESDSATLHSFNWAA
jgi:hypothetical protein